MQKRNLIPVPKWNEYHSWPSAEGLRYLIFNSESNGFNRVIRRIGRRVLIDEHEFFNWVDEATDLLKTTTLKTNN